MAFKRVLNAKRVFKTFSARLSPELRKKWEDEYTKKGLFQLKVQTAQVRHLPPTSLSLCLIFSWFTMVQIGSMHCLVSFPSHGKMRS